MHTPVVDENHLLPEIVDRVTFQVMEEVRLLGISHAEHKHAIHALKNAGGHDDKNHWRRASVFHNAKSIFHAGKSLECLFQLLKGLIKDERLAKKNSGKTHGLQAAYETCLQALADDPKREKLEQAFEYAYYKVVCRHTTEFHSDDEGPLFRLRDKPFYVLNEVRWEHGKPVYERTEWDGYIEKIFQTATRDGYEICPPKFSECLALLDGAAESYETNDADVWEAKSKNWRNADYLMREDLDATTVINADFFVELTHSLMSILRDRYFWHERFLDRMLEVSRLIKEEKVRVVIQQSWPKSVARDVIPRLDGTIDLSREKERCLESPLQSRGGPDLIEKHNVKVFRIGTRR